MQNLLSKYNQRINLTREIIKEIKTERGTFDITSIIKKKEHIVIIQYSNQKVNYFEYKSQIFQIDKDSFQKILSIENIDISVMLEEIYKSCKKSNFLYVLKNGDN